MADKICGECKWSMYRAYEKDFVCSNEDSDYYTDYITYTDTCEEFEQRGME